MFVLLCLFCCVCFVVFVLFYTRFWNKNIILLCVMEFYEYCLYVQKIDVSMTTEQITYMIENIFMIGKVASIEYVKKTDRHVSVIVNFSYIHMSSNLLEMWVTIENGHRFKLMLSEKVYWVVRRKYMLYSIFNVLLKKINTLEQHIISQDNRLVIQEERLQELMSPYLSVSTSEEDLFSNLEDTDGDI